MERSVFSSYLLKNPDAAKRFRISQMSSVGAFRDSVADRAFSTFLINHLAEVAVAEQEPTGRLKQGKPQKSKSVLPAETEA